MSGDRLSEAAERRWLWAAAAILAAIGLALRCVHLLSTPLWLDEAYSAYAAGHDLAFLWRVVPWYETHPPFYYTLLHAWEQLFGDGLASLRLSTLAAGLATVPLVAATARAAARGAGWGERVARRAGLAGFGLACVAVAPVEMARDVRPYALMILVYAAATRALVAILARRRAGRPLAGGAYALHLACLALMLWLHNLGALWAAALGIALLIAAIDRRTSRADLAWIAGGHAIVLLAWAPALAILLDQAPTWARSTWVRFRWEEAWPRLGVIYAVPGEGALAGLVLLALALVRLARGGGGERGAGRRAAAMLLVLALVPTALSILLTLTAVPVFITRTLTPAAVPALVLLALGAVAWARPLGLVGAGAAVALAAGMVATGVQNRRYEPQRQEWYGTVRWLAARRRPGDLILAYPNEGALPLRRALADLGLDWPVRAIPADVPAIGWGDWHPTGNRGVVSLPRPVLGRIAQAADIRAAPTVWLLRLGRETYDPGDMFLAELARGRRIVARWTVQPIDVIGLRRADAGSPAPRRPPLSPAPSS